MNRQARLRQGHQNTQPHENIQPIPVGGTKILDVRLDGIKLLCAVEFGFRCCEKHWNLERTLEEAAKLINPLPETKGVIA